MTRYANADKLLAMRWSTVPYPVFSNRTLTNEELVELERIKEGAGNE